MWDDAVYLKDFLKIVKEATQKNDAVKVIVLEKHQQELSDELFDLAKISLSRRESNVLYKVACHILYKISIAKKKTHCSTCISFCRSRKLDVGPHTVLMSQPNLQYRSKKSVFYVDDNSFKYFVCMEKAFRIIYPIVSSKNKINLGDLITNKFLDIFVDFNIPRCHNLKKTITKLFVAFRLKNSGVAREHKRKFNYSSHTMN